MDNNFDISSIDAEALLKDIESTRAKIDFSAIRDKFDALITQMEIEQGIKDKDGNLIIEEEK